MPTYNYADYLSSKGATRSKRHYSKQTKAGRRKRSLWVNLENDAVVLLIRKLDLARPLLGRLLPSQVDRLKRDLERVVRELGERETLTRAAEGTASLEKQDELGL